MAAEQRQRRGHVFILHQDCIRHVQPDGRKIPYGQYAAFQHHFAYLLRAGGRDGYNPYAHPAFLAELLHLTQRQNAFAGLLSINQIWIRIKSRYDIKAVSVKPLIGHKRPAQFARARQERVAGTVIAQKIFQLRNKIGRYISYFRLA